MALAKPNLQPNHLYQVIWKIEKFMEIPDEDANNCLMVSFKLNSTVPVEVLISKLYREVQINCAFPCKITILNRKLKRRKYCHGYYYFELNSTSTWSDYCVNDLILKLEFMNLNFMELPPPPPPLQASTVMHIETNAIELNRTIVMDDIWLFVTVPIKGKQFHFHFLRTDEDVVQIRTMSLTNAEFLCFEVSDTSDFYKRTTLNYYDKQPYEMYTKENSFSLIAYYKTTLHKEITSVALPSTGGRRNPPIVDVFQSLFETKKFSDFSILVQPGRQRVKVHKFMLASRCSVWQPAQTTTGGGHHHHHQDLETISEWTEDRFDVDTVNALMEFIYMNRIPAAMLTNEQLLLAADAYGVADLKELCQRAQIAETTIENVVSMLSLSERTKSTDLKQHATSLIRDHVCGPSGKELFVKLFKYSSDVAYDSVMWNIKIRNV